MHRRKLQSDFSDNSDSSGAAIGRVASYDDAASSISATHRETKTNLFAKLFGQPLFYPSEEALGGDSPASVSSNTRSRRRPERTSLRCSRGEHKLKSYDPRKRNVFIQKKTVPCFRCTRLVEPKNQSWRCVNCEYLLCVPCWAETKKGIEASPELYEWQPAHRGHMLPASSVEVGRTETGDRLYVARNAQHECGKLNVSDGRVWHIWVQNHGAAQEGDVLVLKEGAHTRWLPIRRGDELPQGVVCGRNNEDGDYVARDTHGNGGKLSLKDGKAWNIRCHGQGSVQEGEVLVILSGENPDLDVETPLTARTPQDWKPTSFLKRLASPEPDKSLVSYADKGARDMETLRTENTELREKLAVLTTRMAQDRLQFESELRQAHAERDSLMRALEATKEDLAVASVICTPQAEKQDSKRFFSELLDNATPPGSPRVSEMFSNSIKTNSIKNASFLSSFSTLSANGYTTVNVVEELKNLLASDQEGVRAEVRKCKTALADGLKAAQILLAAGSCDWTEPAEVIDLQGQHYKDACSAVCALREHLGSLCGHLDLERELRLEKDFEPLLLSRLLDVDGHIVAIRDWAQVRAGMRLVAVNSSAWPASLNLRALCRDPQNCVKAGDSLRFRRPAHADLLPDLRELESSLQDQSGALELMSRVRETGPLSALGPLGGSSPSVNDPNLDRRVLEAWDARLRWEAEIQAFEMDGCHEFLGALRLLTSVVELEAKEKQASVVTVTDAAGNASRERLGKGPLLVKGAGKGPSQGPPGKGAGGMGSPKAKAATLAPPKTGRRVSLFNMTIQNVSKISRPYKTFADVCADPKYRTRVASISDAFDGRGQLLLHACIRHGRPAREVARKRRSVPALIKIVRGEQGPMCDKRRLALELRFKHLVACTDEWCRQGLVLPPEDAPCRKTFETALAVASLDYDSLLALDSSGHIDQHTFLPIIDSVMHTAEDERIQDAFLTSEEQQAICSYAENGRISQLETIERKLFPFVYMNTASLIQKVKILQVIQYCRGAGKKAGDDFTLATNACRQVRRSARLRDLLSVMLQTICYVNYFGQTSVEGHGFSLMKISYFADLKLGKNFTFRSVMCAFLMNLRPRGWVDPTAWVDDSPESQKSSKPEKLTFMDELRKELKDARTICQTELAWPALSEQLTRMNEMVRFIEVHMKEQCMLFDQLSEDPASDVLSADLALWARGRVNLEKLYRQVCDARRDLKRQAGELREREVELQQFAGLQSEDFEKEGFRFIDIFKSVLTFVDRFEQTWREQTANPDDHVELQQSLFSLGPVQMIFAESSFSDAFRLWRGKAAVRQSVSEWNVQVKKEAILKIFTMFDSNGSGSIDALEMLIVLRGLGFDIPEGASVLGKIMASVGGNTNDTMEFQEFQRFVDQRLWRIFQLFLDPVDENHGLRAPEDSWAISADDLTRVSEDLDLDADAATVKKMIGILGGGADCLITHSDFEQLVLMKVDTRGKGQILMPPLSPVKGTQHRRSLFGCDDGGTLPSQVSAVETVTQDTLSEFQTVISRQCSVSSGEEASGSSPSPVRGVTSAEFSSP